MNRILLRLSCLGFALLLAIVLPIPPGYGLLSGVGLGVLACLVVVWLDPKLS